MDRQPKQKMETHREEDYIRRQTSNKVCGNLCSSFDLFGVKFSQRVDGGDQKKASSGIGLFLSIVLLLVIGGYAAYKLDILVNRQSYDLT